MLLIIDDSETVRKRLQLLVGVEHSVAIDRPSLATPDLLAAATLIALDVHFPDENGLDWLERQRAAGMGKRVLVISDGDSDKEPQSAGMSVQIRFAAMRMGAMVASKAMAAATIRRIFAAPSKRS